MAATDPAAAPARAPLGAEKAKPADAHPSGDNRYKLLDAAMKRQRYAPDALIEVLHTAQGLFGYLDHGLLFYVARGLKVPPSRVYGVATFYHFFTFSPKGEHTCVVCLGTACYVKGGATLLEAAQEEAGITAGKTTPDGRFSLETARCLGSCGLAPVVVLDGQVHGNMHPEAVRDQVKGWCGRGPD